MSKALRMGQNISFSNSDPTYDEATHALGMLEKNRDYTKEEIETLLRYIAKNPENIPSDTVLSIASILVSEIVKKESGMDPSVFAEWKHRYPEAFFLARIFVDTYLMIEKKIAIDYDFDIAASIRMARNANRSWYRRFVYFLIGKSQTKIIEDTKRYLSAREQIRRELEKQKIQLAEITRESEQKKSALMMEGERIKQSIIQNAKLEASKMIASAQKNARLMRDKLALLNQEEKSIQKRIHSLELIRDQIEKDPKMAEIYLAQDSNGLARMAEKISVMPTLLFGGAAYRNKYIGFSVFSRIIDEIQSFENTFGNDERMILVKNMIEEMNRIFGYAHSWSFGVDDNKNSCIRYPILDLLNKPLRVLLFPEIRISDVKKIWHRFIVDTRNVEEGHVRSRAEFISVFKRLESECMELCAKIYAEQ